MPSIQFLWHPSLRKHNINSPNIFIIIIISVSYVSDVSVCFSLETVSKAFVVFGTHTIPFSPMRLFIVCNLSLHTYKPKHIYTIQSAYNQQQCLLHPDSYFSQFVYTTQCAVGSEAKQHSISGAWTEAAVL